jgi:hypothetical protein
LLGADHQKIMWDRMANDRNLTIPPKELSKTAVLHFGTTQGNQNIFIPSPNINMSARELARDQKIIRL